MTASEDQDSHPDVIEISDLTEDLLTPERAAEVRSHVASCPPCTETLASLQDIRRLLGELPPEEPMPADVAARIDAALADVPRETSALPAQHPHPDVPRGTSAPAGRPSAPTGPGRAGRRTRGLRIAATSAAVVLALGWGTYQLARQGESQRTSADSGVKRSDAGSAPAASSLVGDQVARLMGGAAVPNGGSSGDGANSPMLDPKGGATVTAPDGTVTAVPACVLQATRRAQKPLAAERENYQGVDSYLVVLPDPADAQRVDAFVVDATCTAATPGHVLFQNSYPRH